MPQNSPENPPNSEISAKAIPDAVEGKDIVAVEQWSKPSDTTANATVAIDEVVTEVYRRFKAELYSGPLPSPQTLAAYRTCLQ